MANQKSTTKTTNKSSSKSTEKKTTKTTKDKIKPEEKNFLKEAAENIEEGAKVVGEKAGEFASGFADKTSDVGKTLVEKFKEGVSEAYEFGSKAFEGISEAAQSYADKYKHKVEIRELKTKQEDTYTKLGSVIINIKLKEFRLIKSSDKKIPGS